MHHDDPASLALADAVREVEKHVSTAGWDGPVRVFALVRTQTALLAEPELADLLTAQVIAAAKDQPWHLTSVEQEDLPQVQDLEELLAMLAWPPTVDGVAITVERIILPPSAQDELPAQPEQLQQALLQHPDRQDVRMAVGVLREGQSWCAVRTRNHDQDDQVLGGVSIVPGLVDALRTTLH